MTCQLIYALTAFYLAGKIYRPSGKLPQKKMCENCGKLQPALVVRNPVSFGFPWNALALALSLLSALFAWVAAVKNPFYSKQMAHDLAEDSMWAKGMFFHVKWTWLGDTRPELVIPSILIYFCSSWWSQNIGLVHYKDHIGESR